MGRGQQRGCPCVRRRSVLRGRGFPRCIRRALDPWARKEARRIPISPRGSLSPWCGNGARKYARGVPRREGGRRSEETAECVQAAWVPDEIIPEGRARNRVSFRLAFICSRKQLPRKPLGRNRQYRRRTNCPGRVQRWPGLGTSLIFLSVASSTACRL